MVYRFPPNHPTWLSMHITILVNGHIPATGLSVCFFDKLVRLRIDGERRNGADVSVCFFDKLVRLREIDGERRSGAGDEAGFSWTTRGGGLLGGRGGGLVGGRGTPAGIPLFGKLEPAKAAPNQMSCSKFNAYRVLQGSLTLLA